MHIQLKQAPPLKKDKYKLISFTHFFYLLTLKVRLTSVFYVFILTTGVYIKRFLSSNHDDGANLARVFVSCGKSCHLSSDEFTFVDAHLKGAVENCQRRELQVWVKQHCYSPHISATFS